MESSSDEDFDDDEDLDEGTTDVWAGGNHDAHERVVTSEDTSCRLAVCNLDWSVVTAADIFVLANSFKLPSGAIHSVTIYPSEFGLERMKIEEAHGPGMFFAAPNGENEEFVDGGTYGYGDNVLEVDQDRVREYELAKLRYYYAVVVCDSKQTAESVYEGCDGLEFEKSQNIMDLRFIPDDVEFDNEPKDAATELPGEYTFDATQVDQTALSHSKLKLSWDEDEVDERLVLTKRKFGKKELENIDYDAYLASSTDDSEMSDAEDTLTAKRNALRMLVKETTEAEDAEIPEENMEITWNVGLKEKTEGLLQAREEKIAESRMNMGEKLEKKRRDKKKARKAELKQKLAGGKGNKGSEDESDDSLPDDPYFHQDLGDEYAPRKSTERGKKSKKAVTDVQIMSESADEGDLVTLADMSDSKHFNMTEIIKRNKLVKSTSKRSKKKLSEMKDSDEFKLNVNDNRFAAVFTDEKYSIDPTKPEFKSTAEMHNLLEERQRRLAKTRQNVDGSIKSASEIAVDGVVDDNLHHLVDSLKKKKHRAPPQKF